MPHPDSQIVAVLITMSGVLAVCVAVLDALVPMPLAEELANLFAGCFRNGLAAMLAVWTLKHRVQSHGQG